MLTPAAAVANHLLSRETWARERLATHAGRTFAITVGPVVIALSIDATGMVGNASLAERAADLTLRISPLDVPSFLADPSRWNAFVDADGDAELAATLADLARTLPWFVERTFASALGPIIGQRAADAGRSMLTMPAYAAARVGESIASYARDEAGLVARGDEMEVFAEQTAALAARTDALAMRLDALAARLDAAARGPDVAPA
jgi:ubiquinone biosynthesis accessory factor UbiJ